MSQQQPTLDELVVQQLGMQLAQALVDNAYLQARLKLEVQPPPVDRESRFPQGGQVAGPGQQPV